MIILFSLNFAGFIKIANLLLECGATTAILDRTGSLFTCPEYEGVRVTIDATRDEHTKLVVRCVTDKSRKALATLQQVWLVSVSGIVLLASGTTV